MHTLRVSVTGRQNVASVGFVIPCDRVSIIDSNQPTATEGAQGIIK